MAEQTPDAPRVPVVVEAEGWTVTSGSMGTSQSAAMEAVLHDSGTETPEQAPPPDSDAASSPPPDSDTATAEEASPPEAPVPDSTSPAPPKKLSKHAPTERVAKLQAEIHALTAEKYRQKAELEALTREREARAREATPPAPPATPPTPPPAEDKPTWAAYEAEGKSWDEYADARDAWHEQRLDRTRAQIREEAIAELQQQLASEQARAAEASVLRVYHDKLAQLKAARPSFAEEAQEALGDVPQTPFLRDVVTRHPAGVEVYAYLVDHPDEARLLADLTPEATHAMMDAVSELADPTPLLAYWAERPDEFRRIRALPGRQALLALGALVASFQGPRTPGVNTGPPAPSAALTTAPPPIRPVAGTRAVGSERRPLEDLPFEQYVRAMNDEDAKRRRRL